MEYLIPFKDAIETLCRQHDIAELYAFGSVLRDDFSEDSDLDFLVTFHRTPSTNAFHQYFDFKEALERLLHRKVDLVCARAIRNPVFKDALERTRRPIYAA